MEELVADAARFDVFRLIDAAMNGQGAQVSRMLAGLRAEGEAVPALLGMVVIELQRAAALARVEARGGNLSAEFKAQRIWDSKQPMYRRALQRHDVRRWEAFVAQAGQVDRIAKGRGRPRPGARRSVDRVGAPAACCRRTTCRPAARWPGCMTLHVYYGGTFDPVHNGHLAIATAARDALDATVLLLPAADPPHKGADPCGRRTSVRACSTWLWRANGA